MATNDNAKWTVTYKAKDQGDETIVSGYGATNLARLLNGLNHEMKLVLSVALVN